MGRTRSTRSSSNNSANIGFEQKLWLAADKLRSNMDAAEYKHVVPGLIFLNTSPTASRSTTRRLSQAKATTPAPIRKTPMNTKPLTLLGSARDALDLSPEQRQATRDRQD